MSSITNSQINKYGLSNQIKIKEKTEKKRSKSEIEKIRQKMMSPKARKTHNKIHQVIKPADKENKSIKNIQSIFMITCAILTSTSIYYFDQTNETLTGSILFGAGVTCYLTTFFLKTENI